MRRAFYQRRFISGGRRCLPAPPGQLPPPSPTNGVELRVFSGREIEAPLENDSPRFLEKSTVPRLGSGAQLARRLPAGAEHGTLDFSTWLRVDAERRYSFMVKSARGVCLSIDGKTVIDAAEENPSGKVDGGANLAPGLHRLNLRSNGGKAPLAVLLRTPKGQWARIKAERFFLPASAP